jgi:hypothetical protein
MEPADKRTQELIGCPMCNEAPQLAMIMTEPDSKRRTVLYQCKCGATIYFFDKKPQPK